ncbi:hypothetical protein JCM8097_007872 [Rhodosporidiobolus ruineniae]
MFAQSSSASPFRSGNPASPSMQSASSPFAQPSSSYFASSTTAQHTPHGFSGPQYGGGNNSPWRSQPAYGSPYGGQSGGMGGSQFGGGSQYGQGAQQGGAGTPGTPGFGDKAKRNYLPGYLSGGVAAQQAESTPPQAMTDDSPAGRRTSLSGSPATRFGGGSLFGGQNATPSKSPKFTPYTAPPRATAYRAEPEEDAPPVASLNEFEQESAGLHADTFNPLRRSPSGDPTGSPFASTSAPLHPAPSSSDGYAVNVFGFPPSALDLVLDYFSQFGEVVSRTPSQEGGNWVTIAYREPWSAARAARKNGEVLGGVLMVGVKAVDEDGLKRALAGDGAADVVPSSSGSHTPVPRPPPSGVGTPSGVGRPVNVLGPQSAFKAQPTPTRKGFLGLGGGGTPGGAGAAAAGGDPQASLFAEKSKQAVLAQQGQQQKGVLGKVSDLVFGW